MDREHDSSASRLIDAMTTLADLLDAENRALAGIDYAASHDFAIAKREAIAALEAIADSAPSDDDGPISGGRHTAKAELVAAQKRLAAALTENRTRLAEAIDIQQKVIATVLAAANDQDGRHYGPKADIEPAPSIRGVSLTTRA